jgi:enterochelin esterase-like enzyme
MRLVVALGLSACVACGGSDHATTTKESTLMASTAGELVSETFGYDGGRMVTVYVPPDPAEAVVFAADGGWHISKLAEALESASERSTMVVGVHGLPDDDGRLREYVPGFDAQRFAAHEKFFVDDVGRWVASRFGVALRAERTAVWGASLGGELALAMGLRHPDVYGAVLAASPGAGFQPPEALPSPLPRVYLVAGRQEQFFLDNATRWADALRNADADVVMMQRDGEHGGAFWGEEFPLMVAWAFGH